MHTKALPWWLSGGLGLGGILLLAWLERRRPLRRAVEAKLRREARNASVAGLSAVVLVLVERPIIQPLAARVERRHGGLVGMLHLPLAAELAVALLLMDYSFYVWHILMHRIPLLWRTHLVHHADLDLDASTALRFHFMEMLVSIPWRAAQVALIGLTPLSFSIWQLAFLLSILFHHSNVELPVDWERRINRFVVTPRMHGIHHSIAEQETNANWSSGLTLWDWLHGTLRLNVAQTGITIGVPAFQQPESVRLPRILAIPFAHLPPVWQFAEGGSPEPQALGAPRGHLLA